MAGAAKAVVGYENPLGRKARVGSSPSARTNFPLSSVRIRKDCGSLRHRDGTILRVEDESRPHSADNGNLEAKPFTSRWHLACVLLLSLPRFGVAQSPVGGASPVSGPTIPRWSCVPAHRANLDSGSDALDGGRPERQQRTLLSGSSPEVAAGHCRADPKVSSGRKIPGTVRDGRLRH